MGRQSQGAAVDDGFLHGCGLGHDSGQFLMTEPCWVTGSGGTARAPAAPCSLHPRHPNTDVPGMMCCPRVL